MPIRFGTDRKDDVEPSRRLTELLRGREGVLVLTGAGISAESGLSTFRGPGGLWEGRDPSELATPEAFRDDPLAVWRFYSWRRRRALEAAPNPGHVALAELARRRPGVTLVTQNVDGLHERAGSRDAIRLHGSLFSLRCTAEGTEAEDDRPDLGELPPRCACGALLRPGVVWFGEPLPAEPFRRAIDAAGRARLVLVVGTSGLVHPAAGLPALARRSGAYVVEINPEQTPLSEIAHERFTARSGEVLPALLDLAASPLPGRDR
jgi:NAD-dependent deacetylase